MSSPTLKEVAKRAGVHVTTASRALNPATSSLVNPATMRKVRAAARALRYQPNAIARGLKTARSMSVGVRGLSCPKRVSLVGFNDMPFVDRLTPPLTTVRVPHYQIGAEAARMLLERLGDPDRPAKSITLPVDLVVRGSTARSPR